MATSGSFNTSAVGNFYFTFEWYRTGYNSSANEHYIHYTLTAHNTSGSYRTVYLKSLWVNGSNRLYDESGVKYYDGNVVASGDMTIASSNSAGDGSFGASFEAGVGISPGSNCSGSGSWDLDRIPRYTTVYNSERGKTLNSISVNWSTTDPRNWTQYSLNNGSWTDAQDTVAGDNKSGYYTINNLQPNTNYNVKTQCRRADSGLWSQSGSITIKTKDIIRIPSVQSVDFGDNIGMTFSNLENGTGKLIVKVGDVQIAERSNLTANYTLTLTREELSTLVKQFGSNQTIEVSYIAMTNNTYTSTTKANITLQSNIHKKVNGEWKKAKLFKKNTTWKTTKLYIKVDGTWRNTK